MINQISFGARYISDAEIQRRKPYKETYVPYDVDFVELDPKNPIDLEATEVVANKWNRGDSFAKAIHDDMIGKFVTKPYKRNYFAIVEKDTFEHLRGENILGICEVTEYEPKQIYLDLIQVVPCYRNDDAAGFEPYIKNIGKALMKKLCSYFEGNDMLLQAIYKTGIFYEKFGFEKIGNTNKMIRKAGKYIGA